MWVVKMDLMAFPEDSTPGYKQTMAITEPSDCPPEVSKLDIRLQARHSSNTYEYRNLLNRQQVILDGMGGLLGDNLTDWIYQEKVNVYLGIHWYTQVKPSYI
jgi:hypothetical protein